jgi:hypothetical protein
VVRSCVTTTRIADHLKPRGNKRAVLRRYRSTDPQDIEEIGDPLRDRDIDSLVVWGDRDVYLPVGRTGRGSSYPSASPTSSPGFCESGSAA